MAAHVTDSVYFQKNCPDTNLTDTWYKVYEEMYHSAYDTTQFIFPETVFSRGNQFYSDTIPIGIMDFSHYVLKPDALTTGTYFDFDTINTTLTDKAGRPSFPYLDGGIFMTAPLVSSAKVKNPVFRIDPDLIFFDQANAYKYTEESQLLLKVDFGDGNGWITIDPTIITNYPVTYSDSGEHLISVAWFSGNNPIYTSRSIIGTGNAVNVPPDAVYHFPGINANYYGGCNGRIESGKTVIYVGGIDVLDAFHNSVFPPLRSLQRTPDEIYREMIQNDRIVQLKNDGYNFLVVDWENSTIDMRYNALYLVNMIHRLKCDLTDDQQFVVMGESMGGVVARYALTYMETQDYQNADGRLFFVDNRDPNNLLYILKHSGILKIPGTWRGCHVDKMHNTRLLITVDAPHQGANIPLSLQEAYRGGMNIFGRYLGEIFKVYATANNLFLDAQAAQQLLLYHIDTKTVTGNFINNYTSHPDKDAFFNQLRQMGNYPRFAKVVTMSNGALTGQGQINVNTGQPRTPNDRLIDARFDLYARVLWIKVPLFGGSLVARTNPNGTGQIFRANAGTFSVRVKLRWFGIRVNIGYNSLLYKDETANAIPYCTSAGGYFGRVNNVGPIQASSSGFNLSNNYWIFNLFHYRSSRDGNGCNNFESHLGLNGFVSGNFDYRYCSDGTHFCFVPVQSALDYGTVGVNPPLGWNIQNADNINTKLATLNPGVDMMIGIPSDITRLGNSNFPHLNLRNDPITNIANNSFTYFSCIGQPGNIIRGMLNGEIGDEDIYLENVETPWQATYQTEFDIHVNIRNPRYEYPNQPFVFGTSLPGIYSRENPYTTGATGFATFFYDDQPPTSPTNLGLQIGPSPAPLNFNDFVQSLFICCRDFTGSRAAPETPNQKVKIAVTHSALKLYPNPNSGHQLTIKYQFVSSGKVQLIIYNATGQRLVQKTLPVSSTKSLTTSVLPLPDLKPGMYILQLTNGTDKQTAKFIVTK